jgi:hypothetical protein
MAQQYEFYSKENMLLILTIFNNYMHEKQGIQIDTIEDTKTLKKHVYQIMNDTYTKYEGSNKTAQQLNVFVLTKLHSYYSQKATSAQQQKPNVAHLERDERLYGNREVTINELLPQSTSKVLENEVALNSLALDKLIYERESQLRPIQETRPDMSKLGKKIHEVPEDSNTFLKKLNELEKERSSESPQSPDVIMDRLRIDNETQSMANYDPKALFTGPISTELLGSGPATTAGDAEITQISNSAEQFLNPRAEKVKEVQKYLSINSSDRDWALEPLRYKYSIHSLGDSSGDLQRRYRNIESIAVGRVVIPEEIIENHSFNHDFSFAYPYLILQIDEFNDVYDGTNDNVRKAFSMLIFDACYKAPNGRGYIILKPIQNEKKRFYPVPLSSLGKLSVSLLKPNGQLLNKSSDAYKILKVEFDQVLHAQYFKIITDVYYDKNEFFVGDEVILQNHQLTVNTPNISESAARKFNEFINRKEGHEIKEIGTANSNGFFNSFYIQAPGYFDKATGQYIVDNTLTNAVNEYNSEIDFTDPETLTNGSVFNNSLQHTISLKLKMLVDDAHIFERTIRSENPISP